MAISPVEEAAIEGSQSLAGENETTISGENASAFWTEARTSRLLLRKPCHAIQTRPPESVAATGFRSGPAPEVTWNSPPHLLSSFTRAKRLKCPFRRADQITHVRLRPSMAIAV